MHICYLSNEYPPYKLGGIGVFTRTVAEGLVSRGHQVTIIGFYDEGFAGKYDDNGINLYLLSRTRIPYLGYVINRIRVANLIRDLYKESEIEIIEGANLMLSLLPQNIQAKKVMRIHSKISRTRRNKFYRKYLISRAFSLADGIIAVSEYSKRINCERLSIPNEHVDVIYNPIDTDLFRPRGVGIVDNTILFVGKISKNKGVLQLFESMEIIVREISNAKLLVVGPNTIGMNGVDSFKEYALSLLSKRAIDAIEFLGPVPHKDLPEIIASATICVYPSHNETLGLTWLEGMAMGKAIVCSRIPPMLEIVDNNINALLCDPHNPSSIAAKLVRLLRDDRCRDRLGRNARKTIVDRLSVKKIVNKNIDYYQKVYRCAL